MDGHCYETGVVKSKMLRENYSNKCPLSRRKSLRENGPHDSSSERRDFFLLSLLFLKRSCEFRRPDIDPREFFEQEGAEGLLRR